MSSSAQHGVPKATEGLFNWPWQSVASWGKTGLNSSLPEGDREVGEGEVEVTVVEVEKEGEESPSGTHSWQQQQQRMKAWPRERQRKSISEGVAAQRKKSRNWPIRPRAGRASARSWAPT